ncbi:Hypothetical_protein [Hexamita inflata]|uniref:Hypothetical_protein n=1 Tax=Hexamita inflata TaxID=28002 RepID=A0AA86UB12_9EUKA|nr:Hypothetical protein HINF_LOCUS38280 [Hexamita inflata]
MDRAQCIQAKQHIDNYINQLKRIKPKIAGMKMIDIIPYMISTKDCNFSAFLKRLSSIIKVEPPIIMDWTLTSFLTYEPPPPKNIKVVIKGRIEYQNKVLSILKTQGITPKQLQQ